MNAVVAKVRELRRGPYYPTLYVVKEDGEPPLRLWALSCLIQDRADVLPSYQQFISQLRDEVRSSVCLAHQAVRKWLTVCVCGRSTARATRPRAWGTVEKRFCPRNCTRIRLVARPVCSSVKYT